MTITNTIREPLTHTHVADIVSAIHGRLETTDGLKEAVLSELKEILDVDTIPKRVKTWVQAYCQHIISPDIPMREFNGKLAQSIDRASLKKRT